MQNWVIPRTETLTIGILGSVITGVLLYLDFRQPQTNLYLLIVPLIVGLVAVFFQKPTESLSVLQLAYQGALATVLSSTMLAVFFAYIAGRLECDIRSGFGEVCHLVLMVFLYLTVILVVYFVISFILQALVLAVYSLLRRS